VLGLQGQEVVEEGEAARVAELQAGLVAGVAVGALPRAAFPDVDDPGQGADDDVLGLGGRQEGEGSE
jgi:hypothetical protein